MKKLLLTFLALTAGFLPLAAQDWAPFRMGHTPYFSSGNHVYSLRIIDATLDGTDSVFTFNPILAEVYPEYEYTRQFDNLFGWKLKKTPAGVYKFIFSDTTEAQINPFAPVGIPQVFLQQQNLDITLLSRDLGVVNNQPDSVLTYLLSNGDSITLSKSYGLLSARSFLSYLQSNQNQQKWKLYRLPEAGMGQTPNRAFSIFDFQPGDKLLHHTKERAFYVPCTEIFLTVEVISRNETPAGDTLLYQLRIQTLTKKISNFCNYHPDSLGVFLSGYSTVNFVVPSSGYPFLQALSFEYLPNFTYSNIGSGIYNNTSRISISFIQLIHDTATATATNFGMFSGKSAFTEGLGQTYYYSFGEANDIETERKLIAYIKGNETYGNWQPLVLSKEEELVENPVQVYPNPFANELTVKLPQPTSAEINIYNLQGQKIRVVQTNGDANLQLPDLSAGLYLLHVQQGEKSYSVKVQKQ